MLVQHVQVQPILSCEYLEIVTVYLHYIILLVLCSLHFLVLYWSTDAFVHVLAVIFSITD